MNEKKSIAKATNELLKKKESEQIADRAAVIRASRNNKTKSGKKQRISLLRRLFSIFGADP